MQSASPRWLEREIGRLSELVRSVNRVALLGPPGSGKSLVCAGYRSLLEGLGVRVWCPSPGVVVDAEVLAGSGVVLVDASDEQGELLVRELVSRVDAEVRLIVTRSVVGASQGLPESIAADLLGSELPHAFMELHPYSRSELLEVVLAEAGSQVPLDLGLLCVSAVWGRPGWLATLLSCSLDCLEALRTDFFEPQRRCGSPQSLPGFSRARTLAAESCAAALLLVNFAPQHLPGVKLLVGEEVLGELVETGFLIPAPDDPHHWGVPKALALGLMHVAADDLFARVVDRAADHLMTQLSLGIPLSVSEQRVCEAALVGRGGGPPTSPQEQLFSEHLFAEHVVFGEGESAKEVLLSLGSTAPALCVVQRARLVASLQDAAAGLQSIFVPSTPQTNCSLPLTDPATKTGLLALRSQLSAETGQSFSLSVDSPYDDALWNHTLEILEAWNEPLTVPIQRAPILEAGAHAAAPVVGLLARLLVELTERYHGPPSNGDFPGRFSAELAHELGVYLASDSTTPQLDDVFLAAIIGHELLTVLAPEWPQDTHSVAQHAQLLSGGRRHLSWADPLFRAKQHLVCGSVSLFRTEFTEFQRHLPRFLPVRLVDIIESISVLAAPDAPRYYEHYFSHILHYQAHNFEYFVSKRFHLPARLAAAAAAAPAGSPHLLTPNLLMLRHIRAQLDMNPVALQQLATDLAQRHQWGAAAYALSTAHHIYQSRRASGGSNQVAQESANLRTQFLAHTPWYLGYTLHTEYTEQAHLTPREREIASLVGHGLSNPQIADRLHCSVRTVESHIANARAKTGAPDRGTLGKQFRD